MTATATTTPYYGVRPPYARQIPTTTPTAADYGGIDPDLAYLDPNITARRAAAGGAAPFAAHFNSRSGRFEGDTTSMNSDAMSSSRGGGMRHNQIFCQSLEVAGRCPFFQCSRHMHATG